MGIWWGMHLGENSWFTGDKLGATTSEAKRYIDFISENGLDGFLVEGWNIGWMATGLPMQIYSALPKHNHFLT